MKDKQMIQMQIEFMINEIFDYCINTEGMFNVELAKKGYKEKYSDFADWIYDDIDKK